MPLDIQIGEHRLVTRAGLRQPQVVRLAGGDLLLTYHVQADSHFAERHGLRSSDGGLTWRDEPRRAHHEASVGQKEDGLLLAFDMYTFERTPGEYCGSFFRSTDGGRSFTGPHPTTVRVNRIAAMEYPTEEHVPPDDHVLRKFYQPLPSYYHDTVARSTRRQGPVFHSNLVRHRGRWLTAMYGKYHGDQFLRSLLVASEDDGATWSFVSSIADFGNRQDTPGDGFCEPELIVCADGSLLCVMRRGGGLPLGQVRSTDGGQTWSGIELLAGHGVDPDLCLMSSGVLACTFGRPGMHIMFSEDGCGLAWGYRRVIGEWAGSCYMSMVEIGPGELLLVYDRSESSDTGRDPKRCSIHAVNIRVARAAPVPGRLTRAD